MNGIIIPSNNHRESWTFGHARVEYATASARMGLGMSAYQGLSDADFTKHFMPRIAVPDHETWLAEDFAASAAMRDRMPHRRNERYGPGPLQLFDLFPAKRPGSPVLVFIHGGYWRAGFHGSYCFP